MKRGFLVTFEGPEGGGKSTQIHLLSEALARRSIPHVTTREPGGTETADALRAILLDRRTHDLGARAELLLLEAARADHVRRVIKPSLDKGLVVVCDRFTDSSLAYQGGGRGLESSQVAWINDFATDGLTPDLTFLLDIAPDEGLHRAGRQGALQLDRLESAGLDFHGRVRRTFLNLAEAEPDRFVVLDATNESQIVFVRVLDEFLRRAANILPRDNRIEVLQ